MCNLSDISEKKGRARVLVENIEHLVNTSNYSIQEACELLGRTV